MSGHDEGLSSPVVSRSLRSLVLDFFSLTADQRIFSRSLPTGYFAVRMEIVLKDLMLFAAAKARFCSTVLRRDHRRSLNSVRGLDNI